MTRIFRLHVWIPLVALLVWMGSVTGCKEARPAVPESAAIPEEWLRMILDSLRQSMEPEPGAPPGGVPSDYSQLYASLKPAVYMILSLDEEENVLGLGTAFAFTRPDLFVTNQHVLEGGSQFILLNDQGSWPITEILAMDEEWDYAVFRMGGDFTGTSFLRPARAFPPIAAPCFAIGNPIYSFQIFSAGHIAQYEHNGRRILSTVSIGPGFSGGPFFNEQGEVLGIVTAFSLEMNVGIAHVIHILPPHLFEGDVFLPDYMPPLPRTRRVEEALTHYFQALGEGDGPGLERAYAPSVRQHHRQYVLSPREAAKADTDRSWVSDGHLVRVTPELTSADIREVPQGLEVACRVERIVLPRAGGHQILEETWTLVLDEAYRIVRVSYRSIPRE